LDKLEKIINEWMRLERTTDEDWKNTEEFYNKNIMPLVISNFKKREKEKIDKNVKYMIVSVGTSFQPIVLSILTVKPEKVLFLYTEKSEVKIDHVIEISNLKPSNYEKHLVEKSNPLMIYKAIKDTFFKWKKPESIYIDFTGGTKAMSAATAMAGAMIGAKLIYISNNGYLENIRKPKPGTEYLENIPNPYLVFGDLDQERAFDLYTQHDYSSARKIFQNLTEKVPDPEKRSYYKILFLLSSTYENWDAIDFAGANKYLNETINEIEKNSKLNKETILNDKVEFLKEQSNTLNKLCSLSMNVKKNKLFDYLLSGDDITELIITIVKNAERRNKQEKYDMSALLLYRVLEMIEQRRLALYGINTSNPGYRKAFPNSKMFYDFKDNVSKVKKKLFGRKKNQDLPENISLLEGYIQLCAFEDEIIDKSDWQRFLKQLMYRVSIRNNSIFAHGYRKIDKEEYMEFEEFVLSVFERYCKAESIEINKICKINTFINPKYTLYCN
jgi:CRISPR-associated protein (TIGR02710 family)